MFFSEVPILWSSLSTKRKLVALLLKIVKKVIWTVLWNVRLSYIGLNKKNKNYDKYWKQSLYSCGLLLKNMFIMFMPTAISSVDLDYVLHVLEYSTEYVQKKGLCYSIFLLFFIHMASFSFDHIVWYCASNIVWVTKISNEDMQMAGTSLGQALGN